MTITTVRLDPTNSPVSVTITRPDGSALTAIEGPLSTRCFGVTSGGTAYFRTAGARPGELAMLGYDGATGRLFLANGNDPTVSLMGVQREQRRAVVMMAPPSREVSGAREDRVSASSSPLARSTTQDATMVVTVLDGRRDARRAAQDAARVVKATAEATPVGAVAERWKASGRLR